MSLFEPRGRYAQDWSGAVAVISRKQLPTVDYYLKPRLRGLPEGSVRHFDGQVLDAAADGLPSGTFVIIVRHAAPAWLRWLKHRRSRWSGVAFLMDDDIPAAWACSGLPLEYRLWTSWRYARIRGLLAEVCDRIWVSNERLQSAYDSIPARVLPPMEPCAPRAPASRGIRRWGYQGTRTHRREIVWLKPVVAAVQKRSDRYEFELFGDAAVRRLYADVPRVTVLPPRPWPAFLDYCTGAQLAVGVAPLLPGRFNAMRTAVKVFDITRCGAASICTRAGPYAPALEGIAAALLPNEAGAWVDAIAGLLEDDDRRTACHARAAAWAARAGHEVNLQSLMREHVR